MAFTIPQLAAQCPFTNGAGGFYMSANRASTLLLIDLSTGSISRMGTFDEEKEYVGNYESDTCLNINNDTNTSKKCSQLILPTHSSTFWLVLTQHQLEALDISTSTLSSSPR